jgi:plasmid maintenance system antidote protein VapI
MQDTTTGFNIFSNLKSITNEFAIPLEKIIGISTDGAKAVSSMEVDVAGRLFKK